jgi:hypothetical protein
MAGIASARVRAIHSTLLEVGIKPGQAMERPKWDSLVARSFGLGIMAIQNLARQGELEGYWKRLQHNGNQPGFIVLLQ